MKNVKKISSFYYLPGLADNRSDKIDVIGFATFDTFGIFIGGGCGCVTPGDTVTFGGDVSDSLVGVIFFLRPRFLVDGSSKSSGGLPNSDGSKSRVFCTSSTVDGMIGSRFCVRPKILAAIGGGIARGGCCCC